MQQLYHETHVFIVLWSCRRIYLTRELYGNDTAHQEHSITAHGLQLSHTEHWTNKKHRDSADGAQMESFWVLHI